MRNNALKICLIAIFSAMLTGGKYALSAIPNVEIVSILIAVFSYVFGFIALPATLIFCATESLIYGFGLWLISYFIYWPLLSLLFVLLGRIKAKWWVSVPTICVSTIVFGALTSLVDVGLFSGNFNSFWERFAIMYARGIVFFVVHILSNTAIFAVGFKPLTKLCGGIERKMFPQKNMIAENNGKGNC
ncbi:MAG: hypothetical protein RR086_00350 [Clostridia bacterium]